MKQKKNPMQFTIVFDSDLEEHRCAADYLNKHGHHKSQIIADAMQDYFAARPYIRQSMSCNDQELNNDSDDKKDIDDSCFRQVEYSKSLNNKK